MKSELFLLRLPEQRACGRFILNGEHRVDREVELLMAAVEPARERAARMLHEAVARLHEDIERVEFWTEVLGCLARPVPDYTLEGSKLNRFNLPGHDGRAGDSDFTEGDELASISRLESASRRGRARR